MARVESDQFSLLYADRVNRPMQAAKRVLTATRERPDLISLAGGDPVTTIFSTDVIKEASAAVARDMGTSLQYGPPDGLAEMKKVVLEVMAAEGTLARTENVFVNNGAQQGLELMGKVFLEKGDAVLTESPTYFGALNAFAPYQPTVLPVPMDHSGMDVCAARDVLEEAYRSGLSPKFIYVIPNFQNPTGITLCAARRRQLLELAQEYGLLVLEDNPYGMLRYAGEALPTLAALDLEARGGPERVVYLGTFSKIFAPGARLGWVHANPAILERMRVAKVGADLGPSTLSQALTIAYFRSGEWRNYVERLKETYEERWEVMLKALAEFMPAGVSWTRPGGGFFVWVTLPEGVDTAAVLPQVVSRDVAYIPGADFYPSATTRNHLRLSFSFSEPELIRQAVQILAQVIGEVLGVQSSNAAKSLRTQDEGNVG
jgi:2-aminoadipate transaminase